MKKSNQIKVSLIFILLSAIFACTSKTKIPEYYEPFTYHSQIGGCGLFYHDAKNDSVVMVDDNSSPIGLTVRGSKVEIPKCKSWGVIVFIGMLKELVPELNENKVPIIIINSQEVSDNEISVLSNLKFVNKLDLGFCTSVSDVSLINIQKIESLKELTLPNRSRITEQGIEKLMTNRPELKIIRVPYGVKSSAH